MNQFAEKCISRGIPAVLGIGFAWLALRVVKNEARLLQRKSELQDALLANSWAEKRRLLHGK